MTLDLIEYVLLSFYLVGLFVLGFVRSRRTGSSMEEYLVAGRRLSLPAFVATLVSTWYGGILGVGEFSYRYGLSNWLVFGVPYYLYAIIFALFIAGRAWRTRFYTIPDQLEKAYGRRASLAGAFFIFMLSTPAPYVLMIGVLCRMLFGWPLWLGTSLGALFSMVYAFRGGLAAIVRTEILQFLLMYAGFAVMLVFAIDQFGGWTFLKTSLPPTHLTWKGTNPPQYIFVWYFIAMSTLVDPNFYQRCYAARSEKVARNGILISVLCWMLFDFMTTTTGLFAAAILPNLENPVESYPQLAMKLLPPLARGLFFLSLLATIMSTIDGYAFLSAITLGKDLLWKLYGRGGENLATRLSRLGLIVTFGVAVGIALWSPSVVDIWYQLGSLATPALLVPLAASFSEKWKMPARWAILSMLTSAALSGLWLLTGKDGMYWLGLQPIYPGLVASAGCFCFSVMTTKLRKMP
ncbi:MAG: sodium:solute symporter family protein [candidate division KSB1 bacterium]|nr:sodium:solute symporter family protein [candidate division KSB1 bacterium]MDZ7302362.1 sodium:solute symporter family protein [candidate division KSB1 bacterium]MDZ7311214.1 sodium:solute symporter family protein [candidate division KSB1 bacterium]